jgi:Ca2+-binding RTX toxin-like protein
VTLNNPDLEVRLGFAPTLNQEFVIIRNDGVDAVDGKFRGLRDGETFFVDGQRFRIDYDGGDGNDVVLTAIAKSEIVMNTFTANGFTTLTVTYEIAPGSERQPFTISFYRSSDDSFNGGDVLLDSVTITANRDLTVGSHTKTFTIGSRPNDVSLPGAGRQEVLADYFLLAVADPNDEVFEDSANNTAVFEGVYHTRNGSVFVHGRHVRSKNDKITIEGEEDEFKLNFNGTTYTYRDNVDDFRVRTHDGNDKIDAEELEDAELFAWGGDGNDKIFGGEEDDYIDGGAGNDKARGNDGDNFIFESRTGDARGGATPLSSDAYFEQVGQSNAKKRKLSRSAAGR